MLDNVWMFVLIFSSVSVTLCSPIDDETYMNDMWNFTTEQQRPCRDEDGFHRCVGVLEGEDICVPRIRAPDVCMNSTNMHCTDDEMGFNNVDLYSNVVTTCTARFAVRGFIQGHVYLPCQPTEFECKFSKHCIPRYQVNDGYDDCQPITSSVDLQDYSDETNAIPECYEESEYRCEDGDKSRCIRRDWVMNGIKDCKNGEDENTSLNCKPDTEFECKQNGRCILRRYVNDNFIDCPGSDDEAVKNFTCIDRLEFSCGKVDGVGRCIPKEWVRNEVEDCDNGEDERDINCHEVGLSSCLDRTRCIASKYLCDGIQHCKDGSDEVELCQLPTMYRYNEAQPLIPWSFLLFEDTDTDMLIGSNFPCFEPRPDLLLGFKCHIRGSVGGLQQSAKFRTVPQIYLHENVSVCSQYEDACFNSQGTFTCARCLDGTIISKSQVCDGVVDCKDLSDECTCEESQVGELCEKVYYLQHDSEESRSNFDMICNGIVDMTNGIDERYCNTEVLNFGIDHSVEYNTLSKYTCSTNGLENVSPSFSRPFVSPSANNASPEHCDGTVDCPLKEDECYSTCIMLSYYEGEYMKNCFPFLSGPFHFNGVDYVYNYLYNVTLTGQGRHLTTDEEQDETDHKTICEYRISELYPIVSNVLHASYPKGTGSCEKRDHKLTHYNLDFLCDIPGVECPWLYVCESDNTMKIGIWRRCDSVIDCNDNSDELNCPSATHFYCNNGNPLFIPRSKVGDGRSDCSDRSDESKETAFSSGTEMLKSGLLRFAVWFGAFAILVFNVVVLRKHFRKIVKLRSNSTVGHCSVYLLILLSISDVVFAFILLTIGMKSYQFSGKYYEFDLEWRSSLLCNMIGIFTVISSQTSMNLLVLMTGLRAYISHPKNIQKPIKFNVLVILSVLCLGVSIFFACIPVLMGQHFITSFYIKPTVYLNTDVVTPRQVDDYVRKTEVISVLSNFSDYGAQNQHNTYTQQKLEDWFFNAGKGRSDFPNRQVDIIASFGFYSSSSVCFPNFFSQTSPASHYSLIIVLYNLFALVLISIGYGLIFYRIRKNATTFRTADEERANKKIRKMMTKILLIVITDILCWLPIIILSIHSYRGYDVPEIVHPLSSIIFLPINSIINPIIYARVDKVIIRNVKNLFSPIWERCRPAQREISAPVYQVEMRVRNTKPGSTDSSSVCYINRNTKPGSTESSLLTSQ